MLSRMSRYRGRYESDSRLHDRRVRSPLNWRDPVAKPKHRFMTKPKNLDLKGLAVKLCELLGAQSGDTIAFHVLQDGSVRVINYSTAADKLEMIHPAV
jgi:hypothetical protein